MHSTIQIRKLLLVISIILSTLIFPATNWAAELNPTQYVIKGQPAPFTGFIVDEPRLKTCVTAVQDANYYRDLSNLQEKFYSQKIADNAKIAELELSLKTKEDAAVEKGLKEELAAKSVWYRQPWFTISATALVFIITGTLLP